MIRLVPVAEVDQVWPAIAEGMAEACRRCGDDVTPWHLFSWVRRSDALLFVATADEQIKAALVVRPEQWGGRNILRILALTGWDIDRWLPELAAHRDWPDALDATSVVFEGREGWKRKLPKARVVRSIYEVDMENGRR
jgi:hypothetical protein